MFEYLTDKSEYDDINISAKDCLMALTPEQRERIIKNTIVLEFEKGETIIKQGFVASHILYIEKGLAKLDVRSDNRTSTVKLLSSDSFVGIMCTFACRSVDFSAVALEHTVIQMINMEVFKQMIEENGRFALLLIQHMSTLTNNMIHWMTKMSIKHIEGALAMLLLEFASIYQNDTFKLPLTRKALAEMMGYSKESVINMLSKFNKEGIIALDDKQITLLDKNKLNIFTKVS